MSEPPGAELARYLHPSTDRRRLLAAMADGHARRKHGRELGELTTASYQARVSAHLEVAPFGIAVVDPKGQPRYLLADLRTNQVAWITPHKEHRSTLFVPRAGVEGYLRARRAAVPSAGWRPLDLTALRDAARTSAHGATRSQSGRIASAARDADRGSRTRVP